MSTLFKLVLTVLWAVFMAPIIAVVVLYIKHYLGIVPEGPFYNESLNTIVSFILYTILVVGNLAWCLFMFFTEER